MFKKILLILSLILICSTSYSQIEVDGKEAKVIKYDICKCLNIYNNVQFCRDLIIEQLLLDQIDCECVVVGIINYTECK